MCTDWCPDVKHIAVGGGGGADIRVVWITFLQIRQLSTGERGKWDVLRETGKPLWEQIPAREKDRQGKCRVGQNSLLLKKNTGNLDLRSELGANKKRVLAESGLRREIFLVWIQTPVVHVVGSWAQKWPRCWWERQWTTDPALLASTVTVGAALSVLFVPNPTTRERNGQRMWNLCVKTLLHELFTQTDFEVNSAVEIRKVVVASVNIQRTEFGPAAEFAVEAVRVWSSRSHTGEFMLSLYCDTRFSPHCAKRWLYLTWKRGLCSGTLVKVPFLFCITHYPHCFNSSCQERKWRF